MKTLDLNTIVPQARADMEASGKPSSVRDVLLKLGITLPPTLAAAPVAPADTPLSLGRFQVLSELGRGGMGRVIEARDPELRRAVAVKVVLDPRAITPAQIARFVAEAQITGQLQHPNIVPVYEMGLSDDGQLFFVMKKVEGRSLRDVLDGLALGEDTGHSRTRLLHAFIQVCNAVAYAHDRSILHRDLKPANIMLGSFGEVLLMDWTGGWPA